MHAIGGLTDAAGADLAQHLRLALSNVWATHDHRARGSESTPRRHLRTGEVGPATPQHLVAAEQALAAYTRRIHRVLDTSGETLPFLAEPRLAAAPHVAGVPGVRVLLLRVSQAVEQLARLLETLRPQDFGRTWRSEHGVCVLGDLVETAVTIVVTHLEATARPTRFPSSAAGTSAACRRRRQAIS